jgi:hypothetical protein
LAQFWRGVGLGGCEMRPLFSMIPRLSPCLAQFGTLIAMEAPAVKPENKFTHTILWQKY